MKENGAEDTQATTNAAVTNGELVMRRYRKIAKTRANRRWAIRGFCIECVGGVKADVVNCTAHNCLLYPWRLGKLQPPVEPRD